MKPSSRATAAARSRDRDRHLADTVDSIAWTAQRLAAEDSTLADERVAWAVKFSHIDISYGNVFELSSDVLVFLQPASHRCVWDKNKLLLLHTSLIPFKL